MIQTAAFAIRFAQLTFDTLMTWPSPVGEGAQFECRQGGTWRPTVDDPILFAGTALIAGVLPGILVTGVRYANTPPDWLNVLGGKLLDFEHPVPYP